MDPKYQMVVGVDVDNRSYVLPVRYMKNGQADGERANYILRELRHEIVDKIINNSADLVKIAVRSNVPPLGIFALAVAYDFTGEVDGLGNYKLTIGSDQIKETNGRVLDRFDGFLRRLAKVSLLYISGAPVPR